MNSATRGDYCVTGVIDEMNSYITTNEYDLENSESKMGDGMVSKSLKTK